MYNCSYHCLLNTDEILLSPANTGGGNMVAIDLIVQHVHSQLEEVSANVSCELILSIVPAKQKLCINFFVVALEVRPRLDILKG